MGWIVKGYELGDYLSDVPAQYITDMLEAVREAARAGADKIIVTKEKEGE
jgi:hypothetical protein